MRVVVTLPRLLLDNRVLLCRVDITPNVQAIRKRLPHEVEFGPSTRLENGELLLEKSNSSVGLGQLERRIGRRGTGFDVGVGVGVGPRVVGDLCASQSQDQVSAELAQGLKDGIRTEVRIVGKNRDEQLVRGQEGLGSGEGLERLDRRLLRRVAQRQFDIMMQRPRTTTHLLSNVVDQSYALVEVET